jgi:hypothetical protein
VLRPPDFYDTGIDRVVHFRMVKGASVILSLMLAGGSAFAAKSQPTDPPATNPGIALPEGPLTAVITAFEGLASVRPSPDAPWVKPTVGMQLSEGAEFRTGPKGVIQFMITSDQTITLDRLGTVQLVRATFENGQVMTDLGLKYGRARVDIEAAGREHDAKVRSPSSVLAVRGTKFLAYDQPPFPPEAISLEGRVQVRDIRRQVAIGSRAAGKAKVTPADASAADNAKSGTYVALRGDARSTNENQLGLTVQNFLTNPDLQVGVFEIFKEAQAQATLEGISVVGVVPNPGLAAFTLAITGGSPGVDVDLVVTSPLGEVVTIANAIVEGDPGASSLVPSGGGYAFNLPGVGGGDQVLWTRTAPAGVYTVQQNLNPSTGSTASTSLVVQNDISSSNPVQFGPINTTLSTANPSSTFQVNLQPLDTGSAQSVQSVSKSGKKRKR